VLFLVLGKREEKSRVGKPPSTWLELKGKRNTAKPRAMKKEHAGKKKKVRRKGNNSLTFFTKCGGKKQTKFAKSVEKRTIIEKKKYKALIIDKNPYKPRKISGRHTKDCHSPQVRNRSHHVNRLLALYIVKTTINEHCSNRNNWERGGDSEMKGPSSLTPSFLLRKTERY